MNPLFDLTGRTALVTGASQGLGLTMAGALAGAGARVILNGRDPARLEAAAQGLRETGATVLIAAFDVTDGAAVRAAIDALEADGTAIDILVNNAGIQRRAPLQDFDHDDWHAVMRANVDSVFFVGQAVARHMIARGRGKIINIGSVQSELGRPTIAPYTASKGAVRNLTRGMCADWARFGIQVNAIGPGYFATPLNRALVEDAEFDAWLRKRTPAGRWGKLEDLHGAVVFLASDASDFVNGQTLYVDGGMTVVV
ncbi:glucose 1-dehydrogenase [Novosphingobium flavum]|uniref:glucose 1-dehydrogenase n=1 Tax=Novosphingobium flavum TaxID=1778672 RepID=UPI001C8C2AE6|nr:glucose 1-dehydrogenase [Novosphingobium flavum]